MRLIDADAMLKRNKNSIYDTTDLEEMLRYEPTAYDVDKVVDELKKNKVNCKNSGTIFDTWDYVELKKAIELVKRDDGGKRMKKIKMKVSFVIVEDVETQEEYFKVTDEMKTRAFAETNFLQKHVRDIENTIKENFTFAISKRGEEIPMQWTENLKIELLEVEE